MGLFYHVHADMQLQPDESNRHNIAPPFILSVVTVGQQLHRHVTPLSELQQRILSLWNLSPTIYDQLGTLLLEPT